MHLGLQMSCECVSNVVFSQQRILSYFICQEENQKLIIDNSNRHNNRLDNHQYPIIHQSFNQLFSAHHLFENVMSNRAFHSDVAI